MDNIFLSHSYILVFPPKSLFSVTLTLICITLSFVTFVTSLHCVTREMSFNSDEFNHFCDLIGSSKKTWYTLRRNVRNIKIIYAFHLMCRTAMSKLNTHFRHCTCHGQSWTNLILQMNTIQFRCRHTIEFNRLN